MPGQKIAEEERKQQILAAALRVATQQGLDQVTGRRVATEAGLSSGLIFFHYRTKDDLLLALLDELIAWWLTIREVHSTEARARFLELVQLETRIENRDLIDLLLEFWIFGKRHPEMRSRFQAAMIKYREMFRLAAQAMIQDSDHKQSTTSADSVAAFASSLVLGNALQVMFDLEQFNMDDLVTVTELLSTNRTLS